MLRDGVCDEATNTEACFFDGGDCCKENKAVWNCKSCNCMLEGMYLAIPMPPNPTQFQSAFLSVVDKQKLSENLEREQVITTDLSQVRMMFQELEPLKTVSNTLLEDVCSTMCLELPESTAWTYDISQKICQCLAFQLPFCQQDLIIFSQIDETDIM